MEYFPSTHKSYIGQLKYSQATPFKNSDWSEGLEFQYFGDYGRPNSVPLVKTKGTKKNRKRTTHFWKKLKKIKINPNGPETPDVSHRLSDGVGFKALKRGVSWYQPKKVLPSFGRPLPVLPFWPLELGGRLWRWQRYGVKKAVETERETIPVLFSISCARLSGLWSPESLAVYRQKS
jgi:hypothetical protein